MDMIQKRLQRICDRGFGHSICTFRRPPFPQSHAPLSPHQMLHRLARIPLTQNSTILSPKGLRSIPEVSPFLPWGTTTQTLPHYPR